MSLFSRSLWRSVFFLLCVVSGVCAAQQSKPQFINVPEVEPTGGRPTSFVAGIFQKPSSGQTDILYINAPVPTGGALSFTAGTMLSGQGFTTLIPLNTGNFTNVSKVVATLGDFDGDQNTDFAFALTSTSTNPNLISFCVYYGTGATARSGASSFSGLTAKDGCAFFPALGNQPPDLAYVAQFIPQLGSRPELVIEDAANNILYILANSGATATNGLLTGFTLKGIIPLTDGPGPIYTGDFSNNGKTDLIVNGQTGLAADVYYGDGTGGFISGFSFFMGQVHSMLMQDMDLDGIPDMVIERDRGIIEIHKNNGDGTFQAGSIGGTAAGLDGFSGNGGHLAAINPVTHDILTTTPIGLSVLQNKGGLNYALQGIYNIGPGRTSFALANFFGTSNLDFAVDSPEGVAIFAGNSGGGFQTSNAYAALQPALGATVGKFRNFANNPKGNLDVIVGTGATQAQLLTGNGDGTFNTFPTTVDTSGGPANVPATVWSNVLSGDFDGDGNLDVLYSLTGLPSPGPSGTTFPILYFQYGNGDGTFGSSGFTWNLGAVPGVNSNILYPESAVGDFNGDGVADVANGDAEIEGDLLGIMGAHGLNAGLFYADLPNPPFNQVAAGFFKASRTSQQDVVFQEGANFLPYMNKQDGTGKNFTEEPGLTGAVAPLYASTVLLTDLDGDGNGDLVVMYYNTAANPVGAGPVAPYQLYIWYGMGDGTFSPPQIWSLSRNYYLGAVADMNRDGLPDIVLSDGSLVTILYNQGNRTFGGEQHFLAGQGINSITVADVNGDGEPDLIVANGGATISNPIAIGGKTLSSISLTANPDVNTGGITVLLNNITTQPPTGTLLATPEPSSYQGTFTLTATLTPSPGVAVPTGTVQFSIDGIAVGTPVALSPTVGSALTSSAAYVVPAPNTYALGTHTLSATYSGDPVNSPITISGSHIIQNSQTTTLLLLCVGPTAACPSTGLVVPPFSSTLTMSYGQTFNGVADATANDNSALNPTSSIAFNELYNGLTATLCTLPIAPSSACPPAVGTTLGTGVGTHVFTAIYSGDATHAGSTSQPVTLIVLQDITSAVTLTGAPNPSPQGQPVTFTATFTGNAAPPIGPVTFLNGSTVIGTAPLVPSSTGFTSTATFTTSTLPVGTNPITASYAATVNFAAATSAVFNEIITPPLAGSFTLTVTPNPVTAGVGYATALTVTVTANNGFAQAVNLACGNLPSEAACTFVTPSIAGGGGSTTLFVTTTAPHSCGSTQPYFLGSNGGGPGLTPLALPARAGLAVRFVPGRRRCMRALVAVFAIAAATQITGCGNCTDLGTRPATYTIQVTGTAAAGPAEVEAQAVTLKVAI